MNAVVKKLESMTPEWWDARRKILDGIAAQSRKRKVQWTEAQVERSRNAMLCALNDEEGTQAYERNGFTREQWLAKWNPEGKYGPGYIPTVFK